MTTINKHLKCYVLLYQVKVLCTFVPNKQLGQLITITPYSLAMLKTTNAEFSFIEIWFTDQNNRPLEIEDNMNITLIIGTG